MYTFVMYYKDLVFSLSRTVEGDMDVCIVLMTLSTPYWPDDQPSLPLG